jgi:hypothetical protein
MSSEGLGFQRGATGGFIAHEVVWFVGDRGGDATATVN